MFRLISFFLFLVLLLALPTVAQSPHHNAMNVPSGIESKFRSDPQKNLTEFVNSILKGITSEEEKVRILHDWTALNIRYDVEGYFGNSKIVYNTFDVIKTGKSVCEGYCNVLEVLLTTAGIENEKVAGYARGYGFDIFAGNEKFESNHAWTAVKLNGKWQLIDVTWNSGFIDGIKFVPNYSLGYYLISPQKFVYTHFPEDPKWQLLSPQHSFEEFGNMPYLSDRFFALGLDLINKPQKILDAGAEFKLDISIPKEILVMAKLEDLDGNRYDNATITQRVGEIGTVYIVFPKKGNYVLTLFAKHKDETGSYSGVADFGLRATAGSDAKFPILYKKFMEFGCRLISPLTKPFKMGSDQMVDFEFYAPVEEVGVDCGGQLTMLTKNTAGNFAGKVKITSYPVRVFVKTDDRLQFFCSWE
ncbi:hypothetical protein MASR2M39_08090 [Ignavibacteriales bacterium]